MQMEWNAPACHPSLTHVILRLPMSSFAHSCHPSLTHVILRSLLSSFAYSCHPSLTPVILSTSEESHVVADSSFFATCAESGICCLQ